MPWNARAGLVLPVAIAAAVLLLENCSSDQTTPSEPTSRVEFEPSPTAGQRHGLVAFDAFTQGSDSSSEECSGGEHCLIQGQTLHEQWYVSCTGPDCDHDWAWSMLSLPSGTSATFDPTSTATGVNTALSVQADSTATTGVYQATIATTPVTPSGNPSYTLHVLCSINHNNCPRIEIVDTMQQGKVVSDSGVTQTKLVGKPMRLIVRHKQGSGTGYDDGLSNIRWHPGDSVIKSYTVTPVGAGSLPSGGDLTDSLVAFYYILGATYKVNVQADFTKSGSSDVTTVNAKATYQVVAPVLDTMWGSIPNPVGIAFNSNVKGLAITLGDAGANQGITITAAATSVAADSENGWVAIIQTTKWHAQYWVRPMTFAADSALTTWWADGCVFSPTGGAPVHADGNGHYHTGSYDSPGLKLPNAPGDSAWYEFQAVTELMFKPGGPETVWVPLGGGSWGYTTSAVDIDTSFAGVDWQIFGNATPYSNYQWAYPTYPGVIAGVIDPSTCPSAFN